jgi:hypothetical protein
LLPQLVKREAVDPAHHGVALVVLKVNGDRLGDVLVVNELE